jgi:HEAT repeat protein
MPLNAEEVDKLIESLPDLDSPPPDPKKKEEQFVGKGKLTGPRWADAEKVCQAVLAGGPEAVRAVIARIKENDVGPAYKPRYLVHVLALYTARSGREADRATLVEGIRPELTGEQPKTIRAFLIRTLATFAEPSVIPSLAPLLLDEDLADAAARTMVTLTHSAKPSDAAGPLLASALAHAKGRSRRAVVQALGDLRDSAAVEALLPLATDDDENTRLTALWALARSGDARAVAPVLKATDETASWARRQAAKAAFVLAESLVAAGKRDDAAKVYEHLRSTRSDEQEAHVKAAAERALAGLHAPAH